MNDFWYWIDQIVPDPYRTVGLTALTALVCLGLYSNAKAKQEERGLARARRGGLDTSAERKVVWVDMSKWPPAAFD